MRHSMLLFVHLSLLCCLVSANDNLHVAFQWRQVDFDYPSDAARQQAIEKNEFIPENNLPLGLEVYDDRLFITVPRWKEGVAASLTYINVSDTNKSPKLRPYPNWEAHKLEFNATPEIVNPFRIKADECGRLWVVDTGIADLLGDTKIYAPNRLTIYDLKTDTILRQYVIPKDHIKEETFLATIAVENVDCENTYAYMGDIGKGALIVYSWKTNTSWQITHHYFNLDPLSGEFNISGINFEWSDQLFGLALSAPNDKGFSTLYFHPLCSTDEFSVSTEYLRDPEIAKNSYKNFTRLGSRGPKGQSTASYYDKKSKVLFYGLVNLNAVACWRTTNPNYTMQSQGRIYMDNVTMVFPNDLKVDQKGNLWVLSDRLPVFMYSKLDPFDVNFRILTAPVEDAIKGTACDSKMLIPSKFIDMLKPTSMAQGSSTTENPTGASSKSIYFSPNLLFTFVFIAVLKTICNV